MFSATSATTRSLLGDNNDSDAGDNYEQIHFHHRRHGLLLTKAIGLPLAPRFRPTLLQSTQSRSNDRAVALDYRRFAWCPHYRIIRGLNAAANNGSGTDILSSHAATMEPRQTRPKTCFEGRQNRGCRCPQR